MPKPKLPEDERRKRVNFSLDPQTIEDLHALAAARRTTASALLDVLVLGEVERERRRRRARRSPAKKGAK